jgi:CheY-like chemotaxis protein
VFNAESKILQRMAPHIQRVLVVDATTGGARLIAELMKEMGARHVVTEVRSARAMARAQEFDPQLVFTELVAPDLDGLEFTRELRRSALPARQAPVIMVTAEATQASITGARNAGVHEFLRKPFTAGEIFRRVENVVLKPRPWIQAQMYVGPDRRRFNSGEFTGDKKRRSDAFKAAYSRAAG